MNHEPIDVVAALILFLTIVTSKDVAAILGPYAAIVVAASAGSVVSLSLTVKDMQRWWEPMYYILSRIAIATVATVALAELVHAEWPDLKPRALLVPIAGVIGLVWDYGAVLRWTATAIRRALPKWLAELGKRDG